jgi:DivIVA domain-containing protein
MSDEQGTEERLTSQDVRDVGFDRAGIVDRGYDTRQVDAFLDRVAATIDALDGTIEALNEEIHRIRRWRQQVGAPDDAAVADSARVYASAHRQVQVLTAHAHQVARQVVEKAQRRAAEIIQQALAVAEAASTESPNGSSPDAEASRERWTQPAQTPGPPLDGVEPPEQVDHST